MRLLLLAICAFSSSASSQLTDRSGVPAELDSVLRHGIAALMLEQFVVAKSIFAHATLAHPTHPAGPVMEAAVLHLVADDVLGDVDMRSIDSLQNVAEDRGEQFSVLDPQGREALAFLTSSRGIVSLEASRQGVWLKAFQFAVSAASLGEDILEQDSSVSDAGLAVGNYYYWKSRRVEFLTWLPFVADSREEGIDLLRRCATGGSYQRYAAMNSLAWILMDAREPDEAIGWIRKALRDYPHNRSLLRSHAVFLERIGEKTAAMEVWSDVQRSLAESGLLGSWAEYQCLVAMCRLAVEMGEENVAKEYLSSMEVLERHLDRTAMSGRREQVMNSAAEIHRLWSALFRPENPAAK